MYDRRILFYVLSIHVCVTHHSKTTAFATGRTTIALKNNVKEHKNTHLKQ